MSKRSKHFRRCHTATMSARLLLLSFVVFAYCSALSDCLLRFIARLTLYTTPFRTLACCSTSSSSQTTRLVCIVASSNSTRRSKTAGVISVRLPNTNAARARVAKQRQPPLTHAHNVDQHLQTTALHTNNIRSCRNCTQTPARSTLHHCTGVLAKNGGNLREAIACYERALSIDANFRLVKQNIAIALTDLGDLYMRFMIGAAVCVCVSTRRRLSILARQIH
jgi:hypothetical protein